MTIEIFDFEQGSPEWITARLGIPTASEFKSVLAKGEGKMRRSYLYKLAGERLTGEPAYNYVSAQMERGKVMEDEARTAYALLRDIDPIRVGFIRNDDRGASPDSLLGEDGVLEIKTREAHLQIEALEADEMPSEHRAQVQGQLWVAEREWCDFVAYWPHLPLLVKRVYRDQAYIRTLAAEVSHFNEDLAALTEKMIRRGAKIHPNVSIAHSPAEAARGRAPAPPVDTMTAAPPF